MENRQIELPKYQKKTIINEKNVLIKLVEITLSSRYSLTEYKGGS